MQQLFALLWLCAVGTFAYSQPYILKAKVVDATTSEGLPFANLYLKDAAKGTTTNLEGFASLKLPQALVGPDSLICTYVGYERLAIPLSLPQREEVLIRMQENTVAMEAVELTYKKPLTAKQILQRTKKYLPDNYPQEPVHYTAFYRETMQENDRFTHLNEAWIQLYASSYPQKLDRKAWQRWHYDDAYAFEYNGATWFHQIIHHFNAPEDQVRLLEARSSANHSPNRFDPILRSGPGEMTSLDLVKFQCDFLLPRNFKRYQYTLKERELIRGRSCYVIQFHPLESGRRMVFDMSRKLTRSIYVGRIYVDIQSFAVMRMDYKLAQNVDFGFYQPRIPLDYHVTFDYKMEGENWHPQRVKLTQVIPASNKYWGVSPLLIVGTKEMIFTETETDNVQQFPEDEVWKYTRWTSLRDHPFPYRPNAWDSLKTKEPSRLPQISHDLEGERALEDQFAQRFRQREDLPPPIAATRNFTFDYPLEALPDPYQWLAQPRYEQDFLNYLMDENEYTNNQLIPYRAYQKRSFKAINNFFIRDTTQAKPVRKAGDLSMEPDSLQQQILYEYQDAVQKHPVLNVSDFLGQRKGSFLLGIRPSESHLAVEYATEGGSQKCLSILAKGTNRVVDSITGVYQYAWLTDSTLLYVQENASRRGDKLFLRRVWSGNSTFLKEENDLMFDIGLSTTAYHVVLSFQSKEENEIYILQKGQPEFQPLCVQSRQLGVEVSLYEFDHTLYLLSNEGAPDGQLYRLKVDRAAQSVRRELLEAKKEGRIILDFVVTDRFLVLHTREGSFEKLAYRALDDRKWKSIKVGKAISGYFLGKDSADKVKIYRSNPGTPGTRYLYDLPSESLTKIHQAKAPPLHRPGFYETKRLWAKTADGTRIPMTVSRSRYTPKKHKGLILKAYGAYGAVQSPHFEPEDVVLMNDGFRVVYAHIRGGGMMGKDWYEQGKLLHKENSFSDYIACAEYLIDKGLTDSDHLVGYGMSAGGIVMGVVANRRPDLFNTIVLDHPQVDVLTVMMNDSIPLTTDEYKELGNPSDPNVYHYQKGYSPYHDIRPQAYPNMLFIAGLQDFQTPTWQIAKHVAKLRQAHTGDQEILFYTDLKSGHKGNTSGKMWIKDIGMVHAFVYGNLFGLPVEY